MSTAERLAAYLSAEAAVLRGQSFTIAGQSLTRADLAEIRKAIADLQAQHRREQLAADGVPSGYAVADFGGLR